PAAFDRARAWLDGDRLEGGSEVDVTLPDAYELRVLVVNEEGEPRPETSVALEGTGARRGLVNYPAPGDPVAGTVRETDLGGLAVFGVGDDVPVVVRPLLEEAVAEPSALRIEHPVGQVTFRVHRGWRLALDVYDGDSDRYLEEQIDVTIYDVTTGAEVWNARSDASADVIETDVPLPLGTYAVEVTARGREPVMLGDFAATSFVIPIHRAVRMRPLREVARLRVELPSGPRPGPFPRRPGNPLQPLVLDLRQDGGWPGRGWVPRRDLRWLPGRGAFTLELRPGRHDLLIALPGAGEVATLQDVLLRPGAETVVRASPRSGTTFRLYDVLPPDLAVRRLRIEVPGLGFLPAVGLRGLRPLLDGQDLLEGIDAASSAARRDPNLGPTLGPYPGPVILHVIDWQGVPHLVDAPPR
ncbi:MAG: hypothetical protein ACC662_10145, partial [Planctomycetota bacterium]